MRPQLLVALAFVGGCAEQHYDTVEQAAEAEFVGMVTGTLGLGTGWTLLNYGCHCGPDSPDDVIWLDDVDNCCRIHDEAYLAAPKKFEGCNCRTQAYAYTVNAGAVTCAAQQVNACAAYCCAEDKKFVECAGAAGPLDNTHASVNRDNACPLAECRGDEDCEGGYYCSRGTCRMYCDPGFSSLDDGLSTTCATPIEDLPVLPVRGPT